MEDISAYPLPPSIEDFDGARLEVIDLYRRTVFAPNADAKVKIVREKDHSPVFYFDLEAMESHTRGTPFSAGSFLPSAAKYITECEYKGLAVYIDYNTSKGWTAADVLWLYPAPVAGYEEIKEMIAFSPNFFVCLIDGVKVDPEDENGFYGGWTWPEGETAKTTAEADFSAQD